MTITDGKTAEDAADKWLCAQGRKLIARNLRFPEGEIDWLGWDGTDLTIVEIKASTIDPAVAVNRIDSRKVIRLHHLVDRIRIEHPDWNPSAIRLEALILYRVNSRAEWTFSLFSIGSTNE